MSIKPKTNLQALGYKKMSQIDGAILNKDSNQLFKRPHPKNIRKFNGNQDYQSYLERLSDKNDLANWKDGQIIVFIEVVPILSQEFDIDLMRKAFEVFYLNVKTVVLEEKLTLVKRDNEFFLENARFNVQIHVQSFSNSEMQKVNLSSNLIIKAQRELLAKYIAFQEKQHEIIDGDKIILSAQNVFSSICFIDHPIVIESSPENIITGRANGYQGAVISMTGCCQREIMTTALHECLHIFSIQHCVWWDCIMNYSYEFSSNYSIGGSIHLCPSCLQKLNYQLKFDFVERYRQLHIFYSQIQYNEDAEFIQKVINTFKKHLK